MEPEEPDEPETVARPEESLAGSITDAAAEAGTGSMQAEVRDLSEFVREAFPNQPDEVLSNIEHRISEAAAYYTLGREASNPSERAAHAAALYRTGFGTLFLPSLYPQPLHK